MSDKLFQIATVAEYNASKETGTWPLAQIVVVRSDYPNADGNKPVFFIESVINPDAPWIVKSSQGKEGDSLQREVEDIKHACWALVDALHQHSLTVMEPGCHIFGFDDGRPEAVAGAVASWCRNPQFAKFAPFEGWAEVIWRNGHYIGGAAYNYGQSTKHDYIDLVVTKAASFHITIPTFLQNWAEKVVEALTLNAEESRKASKQNITGWNINKQVYGATKAQVVNGNVPVVSTISLNLPDGTTLPLASLEPASIVNVYRMVDGEFVYQKFVTWDGSELARGLLANYARKGFVVGINKTL